MRGFALTIEELGAETVCVGLKGELDLEHAYTFDEELKRVEERAATVVLDLRKLSFLDSCGLSRLLAARRRARRAGRRLVLVRGSAAVQRLMAMTAVDEDFEIVNAVPAPAPGPAPA
jgi:anti-sigma B factor antagonist